MSFESLGDEALCADDVHEALGQCSFGLSLKPPWPYSLFIKQSNTWIAIGSWQQALEDVAEVWPTSIASVYFA